jgi:DNA-binding MarR family transcriptional regulator
MATAKTGPRALETFSRLPGHLIRRVHQAATALVAEECGELTAVQYAALVAIRSHPRIDATRVSQAIFFDRSTIGDVLDRLEARGWIVRRATRSDRRIKRLTLSPAGRDILRRVESGIRTVQERLLAPLTTREATTLVRLLAKVAEAHTDREFDGR